MTDVYPDYNPFIQMIAIILIVSGVGTLVGLLKILWYGW